MLTVRVPATSANLGPGFDALGLALDLWNTFTLVEEGEEADLGPSTPGTAGELFRRAVAAISRRVGRPSPQLGCRVEAAVPPGRGLGSSATLILAGALLADRVLEACLDREEILALAAELEGHPDNVAPALFGGVTISWQEQEGRARCHRLDPPAGIVAALAVPETTMATQASRGRLPRAVPMADASFNAARTALFVAALLEGRFDLLREASRDRLHQPYRARWLPGFEAALDAALAAGGFAAFLSGSGPTVLALAGPERAHVVSTAMVDAFARQGVRAQAMVVELSHQGSLVEC